MKIYLKFFFILLFYVKVMYVKKLNIEAMDVTLIYHLYIYTHKHTYIIRASQIYVSTVTRN